MEPYVTRLYASLSEPRPVMGRDRRIIVLCAALLVLAVAFIPFSQGVAYAPSLACVLACLWLADIGKKLWAISPYYIDELLVHIRTPRRSGADEKVVR